MNSFLTAMIFLELCDIINTPYICHNLNEQQLLLIEMDKSDSDFALDIENVESNGCNYIEIRAKSMENTENCCWIQRWR